MPPTCKSCNSFLSQDSDSDWFCSECEENAENLRAEAVQLEMED